MDCFPELLVLLATAQYELDQHVSNEAHHCQACDVCPWAAKKLVRWSARLRYADTERAEVRGEDLEALIKRRRGQLFKLITAFCLAIGAIRAWVERAANAWPMKFGMSPTGTVTLTLMRTVRVATLAAVVCATAFAVYVTGSAANPPSTSAAGALTGRLTEDLPGGSAINGVAYSYESHFLAAAADNGYARV